MFGKIRYNVNPCDHGFSEFIVHLTKSCENKCPFCIAANYNDIGYVKPDIKSICETLKKYEGKSPYVTIGGGEPLLFLDETIELIDWIRTNMKLEIYIVTSVPQSCYDNMDKFLYIIDNVDNFQITIQSYDEEIADKIRGHKSKFSHNKFLDELPQKYKDKIILNVNACAPYIETKEDIINNIEFFWKMGYKNYRLVEIKDHCDMFVDIPKTLGVKIKPLFGWGCKQDVDFSKFIPGFDGKVTMNMACFLRDRHRKATIWDMIKSFTRPLFSKKHFFGVIYEDGKIYPYWLRKQRYVP